MYLGADPVPYKATLMDLSEGGAFFVATAHVEVDQAAYFRFIVYGRVAEATGVVVRVSDFNGQDAFGIELRVGNEELLSFLRSFAAAMPLDRPGLLSEISEAMLRLGE